MHTEWNLGQVQSPPPAPQASSSHLSSPSVQGCALHCLEVRPASTHVLVSLLTYQYTLQCRPTPLLALHPLHPSPLLALQVSYLPPPLLGFLGDKFSCICGLEGAVGEVGVEGACTQPCPQVGRHLTPDT